MSIIDEPDHTTTTAGSASESVSTLLAETLPVLHHRTVRVEPWTDPVVDAVGYPLRSDYVELFWVGILGPTTTWIVRRLDVVLTRHPSGFDVDLATLAGSIGLTYEPGRAGPFGRAMHRAVMFGLAQPIGARLAVRRSAPPLSLRQVARLPVTLQAAHDRYLRDHRIEAS